MKVFLEMLQIFVFVETRLECKNLRTVASVTQIDNFITIN